MVEAERFLEHARKPAVWRIIMHCDSQRQRSVSVCLEPDFSDNIFNFIPSVGK